MSQASPDTSSHPHPASNPLSLCERVVYGLLAALSVLPLWVWRGLGVTIGHLGYWLLRPRRRIGRINLALCLPEMTQQQRDAILLQHFISMAQTALDRIWLWHGSDALLQRRLRLQGDIEALHQDGSIVLFAPHFVGLDAGATALLRHVAPRKGITIYTAIRTPAVDRWVRRGRQRTGNVLVFGRPEGSKPVIYALRKNAGLYLLADMDFGPKESIFCTFFGQTAATVPSVSRFAKLARARTITAVTLLEPHGYTTHVSPAWSNFPTDDVMADTQRMNHELEGWIRQRPHEYFWLHKRFKTRPEGQASVY